MNSVEHVLRSLRRVIRAIELQSKQLVKTAGVTGPQLRLLQIIGERKNVSLRELADSMSLSQATVTSIMDRLEKRKLLMRVRSEQDKRKIHAQLTTEGRLILEKAPELQQDVFEQRFNHLHLWEQHMIIASLQRVAEMMDATEIDASPFLDLGLLDRTEEDVDD